MADDLLAIIFLIIMLAGAWYFRNHETHVTTTHVEKILPPIERDDKKLGVNGAVVNALYDCVDGAAHIKDEPTSFEVPNHDLVNHMVNQLCMRSSKNNMEFFHTSTLYAGPGYTPKERNSTTSVPWSTRKRHYRPFG